MPALTYPLVVEQGADYALSIPVLNASAQPVTVDGWTAAGQIRATPYSDAVVHDLDLTPSGSTVVLRIPAAASATWTWQVARYDVELTSPGGDISRLVEGPVVLRPNVTR
jgi:hypothetical protein